MSKKVALLLVSMVVTNMYAQQDAWVYFTDKPNVVASLESPILILSQKSIDRKQNHNIAIDERDVPVNEAYISDLKNQTGITVWAKSKWFNAAHVRGTEIDINALLELSFVDHIDFAADELNTASRSATIVQKTMIENLVTNFEYGDTQNQVEMITVNHLHQEGFTGEGLTIAVMDSGFPNVNTMSAFQRLRDNGDLYGGYDFVNRNSDVYASAFSSHGTRVLSTMAGFIQDNYVGTAPDASYYLFLTEDVSSENPVEESYWVEAAERADSLGVDIINTSLGYRVFDNSSYDYSPADMNGEVAFISRGATIAAEKGILVVVSAGNAGSSNWQTVGAPADSPHVLSIGGVDLNGDYVNFSSQGGTAQIGYQKPDVVARAGDAYVIDQNNDITQNNGTSFSAPILCGGIASLWQSLPHITPSEMMDLVRQSGSQYGNPDDFLGYGIPDLYSARSLALSLDDQLLDEVKFYPNPVETNLNLKIPSGIGQLDCYIFNQLGQLMFQQKAVKPNFKTSVVNYSPGIYLIKLRSETNSRSFKFIKQ